MTDAVTPSKPLPFGERLREARVAAEMTVADLARRLGVDPRTVAGWQAGRSRPSYERLVEIARILDRPPSFFLDEAGTST